MRYWLALILDRIVAPVLLFGALWLLFVTPAQAQPAYAWAVEYSDPKLGMRQISCAYSLADAKAEYAWMTGQKRIIPIREPLSRVQVAYMWNEARAQAVGSVDTMAHLLAFADLLHAASPIPAPTPKGTK
jgi:hypothetical protein